MKCEPFFSCKVFRSPLWLLYDQGRICVDVSFVYVLPQLEAFIASLLKYRKISITGSKVSLRQVFTWECILLS